MNMRRETKNPPHEDAAGFCKVMMEEKRFSGFSGPGGDLLFRVLRRSTIGAEGFHGRVRDGIGCLAPRCGHQAGEAQGSGIRDRGSVISERSVRVSVFVAVAAARGGLGVRYQMPDT